MGSVLLILLFVSLVVVGFRPFVKISESSCFHLAMSGLACAIRLVGFFQAGTRSRSCIRLLSSVSPHQNTLVSFGRDQCLTQNIRPNKIPFKDLVQQLREHESQQNPRLLVRGVKKNADEPVYFTLEASMLDQFVRKNKLDRKFDAIERIVFSADEEEGRAVRIGTKEVVISMKSGHHDVETQMNRIRSLLEKGNTIVTVNIKMGRKSLTESELTSYKEKLTQDILQVPSEKSNQRKTIHTECLIIKVPKLKKESEVS